MAIWEDFELDCTEYLNKQFGAYAQFIHQGGPDSTKPDIFVHTSTGNRFYIEAKHTPAQCGQFVLLPNIESGKFEYSTKNDTHLNSYAKMIMEYMNCEFDAFRECGTAGKEIEIQNGQEIFSNWIIEMYKQKGVVFFITNDYVILPIHKFADYFEVTAKYRIKRSGSDAVGKTRSLEILEYIKSNSYLIDAYQIEGKKLFVESNQNLHNLRFVYRMNEYMFSLRDNKYEVRKLSNTYHANVIFSIKAQGKKEGISDSAFIEILK
ncbi:MAG: hypothetical protein IKJ01_04355 [Lachnospiraceae bacterium]|nr:hypothetical protein [Lachnospiraceae bacterium]